MTPTITPEALDYTPGELDRTAPERIWLQIDTAGDNDDRGEQWPGSEHVTWQEESIGGLEVQYVRADLAALPELQAAQPSIIEQIAQQWDGCNFDPTGETIDIGDAIRRAGKRLQTEALSQPQAEQQGAGAALVEEGLAYFESVGDEGDQKYIDAIRAALAARQPVGQEPIDFCSFCGGDKGHWEGCRAPATAEALGTGYGLPKPSVHSAAHYSAFLIRDAQKQIDSAKAKALTDAALVIDLLGLETQRLHQELVTAPPAPAAVPVDAPKLPDSIEVALKMYADRLTEWETWDTKKREALNTSWRESGHQYCHTDNDGHAVYIASESWAENALQDLEEWKRLLATHPEPAAAKDGA